MVKLFVLPLISITTLLSACSKDVETMSYDQLVELRVGKDGMGFPLWRGTFYIGSEGGFDYFCHKYGIKMDRYIKVPEGKAKIQVRMPLTQRKDRWVNISPVLLEGTHTVEEDQEAP